MTQKEYMKVYLKKYYEKNKAKIRKMNKRWAKNNVSKMRGYRADWEKKNPEKVSESREKRREEIRAYQKSYGLKNRKQITSQQRKRLKSDLNLRLKKNLRNRLLRAIKGNYKKGSAVKDLGCTIAELKIHLESKFTLGMSWSNYGKGVGKWNIDHIRPLSKFDLTDRKQVVVACNYTNLQPLWHEQNIKKGNR